MQVVTGEYSWVDAAGTRHVTEYRADETGYHIVDIREEKNFVEIRPNPHKKKRKEGSTKAGLAAARAYRQAQLILCQNLCFLCTSTNHKGSLPC